MENLENTKINKIKSIFNIIIKLGLFISSILILLPGILSLFITANIPNTLNNQFEETVFYYNFYFFQILAAIILFFIISLFSKKIFKKIPTTIIVILTILIEGFLFFYWINAMKIYPIDDQQAVNEIAESIKGNWVSFYNQTAGYLFIYPFQFGIAFVFSIIYKLFGSNFIFLECLNAICSLINIIILYVIGKKLFLEKEHHISLIILLTLFSLYFMFFNVFIYGNIIGLTFALLAILFSIYYLDNKKIRYLILMGLSIAISIKIKTNYEIFFIGIICSLLLDLITNFEKKKLLIIPSILIGFIIINCGYNLILNHYNLKLNDGLPMITYLYMGMTESKDRAPGWYNGVTLDIYKESGYNSALASQKTKELINERLSYLFSNPKELTSFYSKKINSTWTNPTFQTMWCSLPGNRYNIDSEYAHFLGYHTLALDIVAGNIKTYLEEYFKVITILIFILSGLTTINIAKNYKEHDAKYLIIPITFSAGFLFHIIWETKALYVIQYYFILLPYAAFGINHYSEIILNKIKKK